MIYFDTTKLAGAAHHSGLTRVATRLRQELGRAVTAVAWDGRRRGWVLAEGRRPVELAPQDWILTVELFSEAERPGFRDFVAAHPCRLAAVFHDAIPLRFPHITWPQSVQRHPDYLKLLAGFDRVWAVSHTSRRDLTGFWKWQGLAPRAEAGTVELGADFDGGPRVSRTSADTAGRPAFLCVGIIEPRKNQGFLLDVVTSLWADGLDFDLHVVGRVNPHFGEPIARRLRATARREGRLHFHEATGDAVLRRLYGEARALLFPTIAEGCGLPLLEALWRGMPCVCSDLPVLLENAAGGGCLLARANAADDWRTRLRTLLTDPSALRRLQQGAARRTLPRWADTAHTLLDGLGATGGR